MKVLLQMAGCVLLLASLSLGCSMSIPQNKLPTLAKFPDRAIVSARPSAFLDVKFLAKPGAGEQSAFEEPAATAKFRELVDKVTKESELFSEYTFEPRDADYHLDINMLDYGSAAAAQTAGLLSGATFGIIPGAVTDNYRLTVRVTDRNGKTLNVYVFEDAVDSWIGIWFAPVLWARPEDVVPAVFENMLRHVYRKISDDNLLGQ